MLEGGWKLFDEKVQGYSFRPPKTYKPTKQAFRSTKNLHGIMWNSESLVYSDLQNLPFKDLKANYTSEGRRKCKNLSNLMDKEVENLDDHGCPKFQELVESDKKCALSPGILSDARPHFTVQNERQKCLMTGQCST